MRSPRNLLKEFMTLPLPAHIAAQLKAGIARPVVLMGLMGAGKTSTGRQVAGMLGWPFTDTDRAIEEAAGQSVAEIFSARGEAFFRDMEQRMIAALLSENSSPSVLALGGGAMERPETAGLVEKHAIRVWLKADLDVLAGRIAGDEGRPLLRAGTDDPVLVLRALREKRYPVFEKADIVVDTGYMTQDEACHAVLEKLYDFIR
jgi:shikimate kinase